MQREILVERLSQERSGARLSTLKKIIKSDKKHNTIPKKNNFTQINLQSYYSFSPYSPTMAVYMAYNSGLVACGLCDVDSLSGVKEFVSACKIAKMPYSVGFQTFAEIDGEVRKFAVYGIPFKKFKEINEIIEKDKKIKIYESSELCETINKQFVKTGIFIDFFTLKKSTKLADGGSILPRHVCFEFAKELVEKYGKGDGIVNLFSEYLFTFTDYEKKLLSEIDNPFYLQDLTRVLARKIPYKKQSRISIDELNKRVINCGGFCAHIVRKKDAGSFDKLLAQCKEHNLPAICVDTFENPSLRESLIKCEAENILCLPSDFVDSPRKKFTTSASDIDSKITENVFAVVGNQITVNESIETGIFSSKAIKNSPLIYERVRLYSIIGLKL